MNTQLLQQARVLDIDEQIELVEAMRQDGYDPIMALDDRNRVVNALRDFGLRVLQVAPGDF